MKKLIVFLLVLFPLSFECFAEDPKPVKVYCFSEDLEAGFKDGTATYFCEQLAKRGKKKESITLVDLDAAHAKVNFLKFQFKIPHVASKTPSRTALWSDSGNVASLDSIRSNPSRIGAKFIAAGVETRAPIPA